MSTFLPRRGSASTAGGGWSRETGGGGGLDRRGYKRTQRYSVWALSFPPSFSIAEVFFLLFFLLNATLVEGGLNKEQRRLLGLLL